MSKALFVALLAAGLMAAPLPLLTQNAPAQTETKAKTKTPPTATQLAERERIKKCAKEWKEAKAAGKVEKGMKWPQFSSACNKRLKGGA